MVAEPSSSVLMSHDTKSLTAWQRTIERVRLGVVVLHYGRPHSIEDSLADTGKAIGFVVDAQKGWVLTAKHVTGEGPFFGRAIFDSGEEVDVSSIYVDPLHDIGFLQYDPKSIQFIPTALDLCPTAARVDMPVAMFCNPDGRKPSVRQTVISKIHQNPPQYTHRLGDINIKYIHVATNAESGSSGSPVVMLGGTVVGLVAGGRVNGSSEYLLPLDQALIALSRLRSNKSIARGTLNAIWEMMDRGQCESLGLPNEEMQGTDDFYRLVMKKVLPKSAAEIDLRVSDLLLAINGQHIRSFNDLRNILDANVGDRVTLEVFRGGERKTVMLTVQNLEDDRPKQSYTFAGGRFHSCTQLQKMTYNVSQAGVYMSEYLGTYGWGTELHSFRKHWVITAVNNISTPNLESFIAATSSIPDQALITITYVDLRRKCQQYHIVWRVRRIGQDVLWTKDKHSGAWIIERKYKPPLPEKPARSMAAFAKINDNVAGIRNSLVQVEFRYPARVDRKGAGLVIDAERGWVLIPNATVPHRFGDVAVIVADTTRIAAHVVFSHVLGGYSVIQYDPGLVEAPIKSAQLSKEFIRPDMQLTCVGFDEDLRPSGQPTRLRKVMQWAPEDTNEPNYRPTMEESLEMEGQYPFRRPHSLIHGDGTVQAIYLVYSSRETVECWAVDATRFAPVIENLRAGTSATFCVLPYIWKEISMLNAKARGLNQTWYGQIASASNMQHGVFQVAHIDTPTSGWSAQRELLEQDDILLELDGTLVTEVSQLGTFVVPPSRARIIRGGKVMEVNVVTVPLEDFATTRLVEYWGALLQRPTVFVRRLWAEVPSEVYVSAVRPGSPASFAQLGEDTFITHVNSQPTPNLDAFLRLVGQVKEEEKIVLTVNGGVATTLVVQKSGRHVCGIFNVRRQANVDVQFPNLECVASYGQEPQWKTINQTR
jgi:pro-apoptotic serine protease NMA111